MGGSWQSKFSLFFQNIIISLWDLVFSLFGVNWVLPFTVRDTLLSWYVSFKDKKHRKVWRAVSFCLFWMVWKERNRIVFDNEVLSIQRLKNSFVCNLLSWAKSSIVVDPLTLFNFVDWLDSYWGRVSACFFVFFVVFFGDACILPVCFGSPFKHPLSNISLCVYL